MAVNNGDSSEQIILNVLVVCNDDVIGFKIMKHSPLKKLMNAYCERTGLVTQTVRFWFNGQRIMETDTPSSLKMEEGDTIEIYREQTGGCFYFNYY